MGAIDCLSLGGGRAGCRHRVVLEKYVVCWSFPAGRNQCGCDSNAQLSNLHPFRGDCKNNLRLCLLPYYSEVMRTLAGILLGMWLALMCVVAWVAAENFFMIDRLLATRPHVAFATATDKLGSAEARLLLRYLSSELNRHFFTVAGWIGLGLGAALLSLSVRLGNRQLKIGLAIMLVITAVMAFYLTPQIVNVGRELDFVAPDANPAIRAAFGRLHGMYSSLEMVKLGIGLWMCIALARSGTSSAQATH
jgi:hypothetical protein